MPTYVFTHGGPPLTSSILVFCCVEDDMVHHGDADGEADAAKEEECCVAGGEPASERQTPVGSVNGQSDTDDKENNNDMSTDGTQAVRYGTHPRSHTSG